MPKDILQKLATHKDWGVRAAVAKNPNTPAEALKALANDDNTWVRDSLPPAYR